MDTSEKLMQELGLKEGDKVRFPYGGVSHIVYTVAKSGSIYPGNVTKAKYSAERVGGWMPLKMVKMDEKRDHKKIVEVVERMGRTEHDWKFWYGDGKPNLHPDTIVEVRLGKKDMSSVESETRKRRVSSLDWEHSYDIANVVMYRVVESVTEKRVGIIATTEAKEYYTKGKVTFKDGEPDWDTLRVLKGQ